MAERARLIEKKPLGADCRSGRMSRWLRFVFLIIAIGVIVNVTLALLTSDSGTVGALERFPLHFLVFAALLTSVPFLTDAFRLLWWSRFFGVRIRYPVALRVVLGTQLGAAISPTAVGGGPAKIGLLVEAGHSTGRAAVLTSWSSVEDFLAMWVLLPLAAIHSKPWEVPAIQAAARAVPDLVWQLVATVVMVLLIALVLGSVLVMSGKWAEGREGRLARASRKLVGFLKEFLKAYRNIGVQGSKYLPLTVPVAMVKWAARYSIVSVLAYGLGAQVDVVLFFVLQWIVFTLTLAIPTPGASGGAEAAFAAAHAGLIPTGVLGVATAGWRFFTFYLPLIMASVGFNLLKGPESPKILQQVD